MEWMYPGYGFSYYPPLCPYCVPDPYEHYDQSSYSPFLDESHCDLDATSIEEDFVEQDVSGDFQFELSDEVAQMFAKTELRRMERKRKQFEEKTKEIVELKTK